MALRAEIALQRHASMSSSAVRACGNIDDAGVYTVFLWAQKSSRVCVVSVCASLKLPQGEPEDNRFGAGPTPPGITARGRAMAVMAPPVKGCVVEG
jgi:hypothetical protein